MSYKTERGNVAKKCQPFHATIKMVSDYQLVTKVPVAASRRYILTTASWQWCGLSPAVVISLDVRFTHQVRASPDTHSQGHGRPCLQKLHLRRGFSSHMVFPDGFSVTCASLHQVLALHLMRWVTLGMLSTLETLTADGVTRPRCGVAKG